MKNEELVKGGRQREARNRNLPQLLTPAEVAAVLGVRAQTLTAWRHRGSQELPYVKAGRLVRYRAEDLERFLESRTVGALQEGE